MARLWGAFLSFSADLSNQASQGGR